MKQLNKKTYLLVFFVFLLFSIFTHLYFDYREILSLFSSNITKNYISHNQYFFACVFIILNSIYIFFLGSGTLSTLAAIVLFNPYLALFVCVLSKTLGSTLSIFLLSKVISKPKIKKNYNFKFLSKIKNYHMLNIIILRMLPGIPVAVMATSVFASNNLEFLVALNLADAVAP